MISLFLLVAFPQGQPDLEAARRSESERVAVVAAATPSVCSVMALNSPGGGSGVVIDPLGFVVTNFHVVARRSRQNPGEEEEDEPGERQADSDQAHDVMKIGLPDGGLYLADVLGIDPGSDLAVLLLRPREDGQPYPYSSLGDSDELLVGEPVFAMGNPFLLANDFTPTLTSGIVSGTHRYQPGQGNRVMVYPDCIQVDAAINPGNSGGPLFNERGEVVGINGRITVRDRGRVNTGVGFAISSNQLRNFLADLMAGKHAEHGTLDMNAWFMKAPGEQQAQVIVQSTFADSRVAELGLGLGDRLTDFNGVTIRSANQLATLVGVLPAQSWVTLGFTPHLADGGFGSDVQVTFQLPRLDTGSSLNRGEPRLAPPEKRHVARRALSRRVGIGEETTSGATVVFVGPAGEKITVHRLGEKLRWSDGERVLIRTGEGRGFKIERDEPIDLTADEISKVDREHLLNPWLWQGPDRRKPLADATLEGGILVQGQPAYRYRVPGPSEFEVFYYPDGSPAGYRYRDQLRRQLVDVLVHGRSMWIVSDRRTLAKGWTLEEVSYDPLPPERLFARQDR